MLVLFRRGGTGHATFSRGVRRLERFVEFPLKCTYLAVEIVKG